MPSVLRRIPLLGLTGQYAVELESNHTQPIILRRLDADGVDIGAVNLAPYDTANINTLTGTPSGTGYSASFRDTPQDTSSLFDATVAQNGLRAECAFQLDAAATEGQTVVISYPDMSDPTVAAPTVVQTYTFKDTPAAADHIQVTTSIAEDIINLTAAINGTYDYGDPNVFFGTAPCTEIIATADTGATDKIYIEARDGGVWGNRVSVTAAALTTTPSYATAVELTGGTGTRGVTLTINHTVLPSSLITTGRSRKVHWDLMGLNDSGVYGDPTKLITGPCTLYASNTVTS